MLTYETRTFEIYDPTGRAIDSWLENFALAGHTGIKVEGYQVFGIDMDKLIITVSYLKNA